MGAVVVAVDVGPMTWRAWWSGRTTGRDKLAGTGDAHPHSHPRKSSPEISNSIVLRPKVRSSRLIC